MITEDEKLIQQALDGALDPQDFAAFQDRLREEPELVGLYGDYAILNHGLQEHCEEPALIELPNAARKAPAAVPFPKAAKPSRWPALAAVAAVALAATAAVWLLIFAKGDPATLAFSADATWELSDGQQRELAVGETLELTGGHAKLELPSGATAVLSAPTSIALRGDDHLFLASGRGRFEKLGGGLVVETEGFTATDLGTTFGVAVAGDGSGQLHVFSGAVDLASRSSSLTLTQSEAASIASDGSTTRHEASEAGFPAALPQSYTVFKQEFASGLSHHWWLEKGEPEVVGGALQGTTFRAFRKLSATPGAQRPVLLITLQTATPTSGDFHSGRWAGLSLFTGDEEVGFFGDCHGPDATWSLDLRQGQRPIHPASAIDGARTVTLRYDWRSGETSLHEGFSALGEAFVTGNLPARLSIDRIRVGASSESSIAAKMVAVRLLSL